MKTIKSQIENYKSTHPVSHATHTGKWGYERVNGCLDLSKCVYKTERAAKLARARDAKIVAEIDAMMSVAN